MTVLDAPRGPRIETKFSSEWYPDVRSIDCWDAETAAIVQKPY